MIPLLVSQEVAAATASDVVQWSATSLAVGAVLTASGVATAPLAGQLVRALARDPKVFFARWGFSHVLAVVVVVLLALVAGRLVGGGGTLAALYRTMAALGVGASFAATIARRLHPEGLRALGWSSTGNLRGILGGSLAYVLVLPAVFGLGLVWPALASVLELDVRPQEVLVGIGGLEGMAFAQAAVLAVLVGPLLEETLFRGFLQPLFVQNFRERGGVVLTSLLFAALHGSAAFLPLFGLSLLLGTVQLRTRRLAASWFVHGLHNAITLALLALVPEWQDELSDWMETA